MNNRAVTNFKGSLEIADRIRSARARAGLTRKQLAAASNASERYLATLEAGMGNPSVEMLVAIAEALNIAMAELLPLGGEQDSAVGQAASQLRRLPPERIPEALAWLKKPSQGRQEKAQRVSLVGLRGAGKTSLGKKLASRMNIPFFEISKEIEKHYGGSIAVLMEINGPTALQRYEGEVLKEILGNNASAIIAAPGAIVSAGALYDKLLESSWTVWLEASPEDHMQRVVAQGDIRPMAGNRSAMNDLKNILAARELDYARADARINTSLQDFDATLDILEGVVDSFA
tara:strand:+ start:78346 stop:79209 length:864 start_codon:yes stop_codon:yes gene_type:complete